MGVVGSEEGTSQWAFLSSLLLMSRASDSSLPQPQRLP